MAETPETPEQIQPINSISPEASCLVYVSVSLAGYEILAFEKPCLHYHKISTECQLIYTWSKWKRTNRKHATIYGIFSRKVRT